MSDATATTTSSFDPARAEAFGERMVGVLNDAYLALLTATPLTRRHARNDGA